MPLSRRTMLALVAQVSGPAQGRAGGPPHMTALPLPYDQVSFQRDEREIARFHFGPGLIRPFVYPVIGPSGRTLTRMGHPLEPHSHSHHNSVWISHSSVNGVDFWTDRGKNIGRIVHRETVALEDGDERAGVVIKTQWVAQDGTALLEETRETWAVALPRNEWVLAIDLTWKAPAAHVTLQRAGFGPIGVRVAKAMSVQFGDGAIRNSAGAEGEPAIFRKPAKWVDYSGSVAAGIREGLTLMDHPTNPGHPSPFHVRSDGWMGAMLPLDRDVTVTRDRTLHLRYGVYVHAGAPQPAELEKRWAQFAKMEFPRRGKS